jgi:hypothetical protein
MKGNRLQSVVMGIGMQVPSLLGGSCIGWSNIDSQRLMPCVLTTWTFFCRAASRGWGGEGRGGVGWGGVEGQKEDRIKVVLSGAEGAQEGALLKPLGSLDGSQGV